MTIAMQYRAWKKSIMKFKNVNTPLIQNPRRTECSEATEATVHHKPKCMSCHKAIAIVLITGRAHCFYDYIYTLHQSCFLALCVFHNYIYIHHIHLASQHYVSMKLADLQNILQIKKTKVLFAIHHNLQTYTFQSNLLIYYKL